MSDLSRDAAAPAAVADPSGHRLAIASFVLGVCGLSVLPLVGSIAAVVTGHLARRRLAEAPGDGGGFAIAGLWLGYLVVLAAALLLVLPLAVAVLRSGAL